MLLKTMLPLARKKLRAKSYSITALTGPSQYLTMDEAVHRPCVKHYGRPASTHFLFLRTLAPFVRVLVFPFAAFSCAHRAEPDCSLSCTIQTDRLGSLQKSLGLLSSSCRGKPALRSLRESWIPVRASFSLRLIRLWRNRQVGRNDD